MSEIEGLKTLLQSLFSAEELRRFVRDGPEGQAILRSLPATPSEVSLDLLFERVVEAWRRRGLLGETLAVRLREARPHRVDDINKLLGAPPATAPRPEGGSEPGRPPLAIQERVRRLLDGTGVSESAFTFQQDAAFTEDDEAGLSTISNIVDKHANKVIRVIGRGSQRADSRTAPYIRAVAGCILRGVEYRRILVVDPALPENALLWTLLLERFLGSPRYRHQIFLRIKHAEDSNFLPQFQIVDNDWLHTTNRFLSASYEEANRRANSMFAIAPHPAIRTHRLDHEQYEVGSGAPATHDTIASILDNMLNSIPKGKADVRYHWGAVTGARTFIEANVGRIIPEARLRFVGSLMPFTYTHEAAKQFCAQHSTPGMRVLPLPFESLDMALKSFRDGLIDYVCVPRRNSTIGDIAPPVADQHLLEEVESEAIRAGQLRIPVDFVLAGRQAKASRYLELAGVAPALEQAKGNLPAWAERLDGYVEARVTSNFHAAEIAMRDRSVLALTNDSSAQHFGLRVCARVDTGSQAHTTFQVFGHRATSPPR